MAAVQINDVTTVDLNRVAKSELDTIDEGWVEIRVYKSKNALENYDVTTHGRRKGKIALIDLTKK